MKTYICKINKKNKITVYETNKEEDNRAFFANVPEVMFSKSGYYVRQIFSTKTKLNEMNTRVRLLLGITKPTDIDVIYYRRITSTAYFKELVKINKEN